MPYALMYAVPLETIFATPQSPGPMVCSPTKFKPIGDWLINCIKPITDCNVPKHTKSSKKRFLFAIFSLLITNWTVPYETTVNSMNLTKNHIFKPEIGQLNIKVARISQIMKAKSEKRKAKNCLRKPNLFDHKVKIKAINRNISLEYKEIEVKSEYKPVAKPEAVGKT